MKPKETRSESVTWCNFKDDVPNCKENLFFAMLVVWSRSTVAQLMEWVGQVLRYEAAFQSQGAAGLPADWLVSVKVQTPAIYGSIADAYANQAWDTNMLERIADAMRSWKGAGAQLGLTVQRLRDHFKNQAAHKKAKPKAKLHLKTPAALFGVARLIKDRRGDIEQLLKTEQPPVATPDLMEAAAMQAALAVDLADVEV